MADVFVPLNRFQSVVSELTGEEDNIYNTPAGVSTIVLSAQLTNTGTQTHPATIFVISNQQLPEPDFSGLELTGSYVSASTLLTLNEGFIKTEVGSYIQFLNSLSEEPFGYSASYYETNILRDLRAVSYDISNNTTIRTSKSAKRGYFNKNGDSIIPTGQISASVDALEYARDLALQVIKNESVTGSVNVTRLYQSGVTQSFDTTYTTTGSLLSGSSYVIDGLYQILINNIESPNLVDQTPIDLIRNVEIPAGDSLSPVVAGKLVLEENYGLVVSASADVRVILSILESANE
jgi:hypothetical protein